MAYTTNGMIGVDLSAVTAGTTTDGASAKYTLGTRVPGNNNSEYIYVQAGAAISTTTSEPYALAVDENFQAVKITSALAGAGHIVAVAPRQIIADNAFFWACTRGTNIPLRVAASCAADVNLWCTATAGRLDDTSGGGGALNVVLGVKIVTAASASTSAGNTIRNAIITNTLVPQLIA
jgi:hypothetical protein